MATSRIRSGYQRRILDELLDGPATVTALAARLSLATSHTSSTLRTLRQQGLVTRDEREGVRGAPHHLSPQGLIRLQEDALERLRDATRTARPEGTNVLLTRDGPLVVLAYGERIPSDLIWLPPRRLSVEGAPLLSSSGNARGGAWCAVRSAPQWFDLDTLEPCEPPPPEMPLGDIRTWTQDGRRLALVRARVMSGQDRWTMPPGTWFETEAADENPPAALNRSEVNLGTVRGTEVPCRPSTPILGQVGEAWRRESLLSGQKGLIVLRSSRPDAIAERPVSLLHLWMRHRHPRLRGAELDRRTQRLLERLRGDRRGRPSAVAHAALAAFGPSTWVEHETTFHELARANEEGARAIWEWALEHAKGAVQGEWTLGATHKKLLKRIIADGRCQLLLAGDARLREHKQGTWLVDTKGERWVHLNEVTRLRLTRDHQQTPSQALWQQPIPASAASLLAGERAAVNEATARNTTGIERELRRALSAWPDGDDDLADTLEHEHPLAAWIASSEKERGRRWRRIGERVPDAWVGLHAPQRASDEWLSEAADRAAFEEREAYALELARRYEQQPRPRPTASLLRSVASTARLLTLRDGQSPEASDVSTWADDPLHFAAVLPRIWGALEPAGGNITNARLQTWHDWMTAPSAPPSIDVIIRRCEDLPHEWWAPWLPEWLPYLLASARGRRWLSNCNIAWPVVVATMDSDGPPGLAPPSPALNFEGRDLSDVHLVEEKQSTAALFDVAEGVMAAQEGRPTPVGRTHPEACWLVSPPHTWPTFVGLGPQDGPVGVALSKRRLDR